MTVGKPEGILDATNLEILWQRLITIMNEVDQMIVRTTFSTILSEGRDFACILMDKTGASLCQSVWSTATFSVVLPRTARKLLERFPIDTLAEGDVLATNDPWIGTGHLPDYCLLTPVFWEGAVIAFLGTVSHMSDVGGHPAEIEGYDVFSEGLWMPPFKLYEAGEENALAFEIIGRNCRVPDMLLGDLRAMAGATRVGAGRVREFLTDYGLEDIDGLATEILTRSENLMRRRIAELPDGVYEYGLDIDGYIDTVHLQVKVTIKGEEIDIDYSGSSPQTRKASINSVFNSTYAPSTYPFKSALAPDVPNNEGLFRPITVRAPEGSILNATYPVAVKARAKTINNVNQVLFGALWPVFGERVQASNGGIWPLVLLGDDPELGNFLVDMLPHGGRGGMPSLDGMIPVSYPENSTITPCEIIETKAPVRFRMKELRPDSGGPGRHRGGLGQVIVFESIGTDTIIFNLTPDRITTLPQGLNDGQPGRIGEVFINGEKVLRFPPIQLQPGDVVELHLAGGGGFGPVDERAAEQILHDLGMGYITPAGAREDYGFDPEAGERR
ncbi:MAG: hydantoinase B/oxoprolinase family protein [Thermaerobacterales bacterium]